MEDQTRKDRKKELEDKLRQAQEVPSTSGSLPVEDKSLLFPENHLEEDNSGNATEVFDEGEQASAVERNFLAASLRLQQEKLKPQTHPDFNGTDCLDCGDEIPAARLAMHRIRCVHCQTALEKLQKIRGY